MSKLKEFRLIYPDGHTTDWRPCGVWDNRVGDTYGASMGTVIWPGFYLPGVHQFEVRYSSDGE